MAYTIIHRTGLSRGRVYNGTGENLTENPAGAGNDFVGPYAQDYASLNFGTNVNYDHEFSGIILDGRAMKGSGNTDDSLLYPDLDEDEDLSDRGSVVGRDTNSAKLSAVTIKMTHTRPRWADASVWRVPHDGTQPELLVSFDEWLDQEVGAFPEWPAPMDDTPESAYKNRTWSRLRHYVQVPYYWALYKVPLGPNYEGLSQMIVENSANVVGQSGQLSYGPLGMLTALHGALYASQHAYRLYEPTTIVSVERGYGLMPYDSSFNDVNVDGDGQVDPDLSVGEQFFQGANVLGTIDLLSNVGAHHGPQGSGYRRGGVSTWAVHSKRDVRAAPNEVYLWHFATAPVRIDIVEGGAGGGGSASLIVGNAVSPFYGPFMHCVYHECTARFSAR